MKEKCIIVGAGTYGQVYAEYLKNDYDVVGFIDDNHTLHNKEIEGIEVLGDINYLLESISIDVKIFVPIGNVNAKETILEKIRNKGFKTPNFIHPTANIHDSVTIGEQGVYILQGVVIMPLTVINNDVMISAGSIISHHSVVEDGCFISFGVNVGASLIIRKKAYLGISSTIMTGVKEVGGNSTIGAGAVIIRDVPDFAVVVGNPGKIIKYKGDK